MRTCTDQSSPMCLPETRDTASVLGMHFSQLTAFSLLFCSACSGNLTGGLALSRDAGSSDAASNMDAPSTGLDAQLPDFGYDEGADIDQGRARWNCTNRIRGRRRVDRVANYSRRARRFGSGLRRSRLVRMDAAIGAEHLGNS
jgi:hypothetical protein